MKVSICFYGYPSLTQGESSVYHKTTLLLILIKDQKRAKNIRGILMDGGEDGKFWIEQVFFSTQQKKPDKIELFMVKVVN